MSLQFAHILPGESGCCDSTGAMDEEGTWVSDNSAEFVEDLVSPRGEKGSAGSPLLGSYVHPLGSRLWALVSVSKVVHL